MSDSKQFHGAGHGPTAEQKEGDNPSDWRGSAVLCIVLGLAGLIGGFALLLNDSHMYAQKVAVGEAAAIVGGIFLAAGIRPR
jgi:hypothetical protein